MPPRPRRRIAQKRYLLLGAAVALPVVVILLAPVVGARLIRTHAIPKAEARLGRKVEVGEIRVRWGRAELSNVAVDGDGAETPLKVPQVTVGFAMAPLLAGKVALTTVTLERPRISVVRGESGDDNVSSILERLRQKGSGDGGGGGTVSGPREVQINDGKLSVDDEELGELEVPSFSARLRRDGPCHAELTDAHGRLATGGFQARAAHLQLDFQLAGSHLSGLPALTVDGGAVTVWKGFSLTGVVGSVAPDPAAPERANVDLKGGYGGVDRILWDAKGWVVPGEREAEVQLNAARFHLSQLKPILANTPIVDPELAEIDARMRLRYHGDRTDPRHLDDVADFDGSFHLSGLAVFHPMLGPDPVRHLGFDASIAGHMKPRRHTLRLDKAQVDYRGVTAKLVFEAERQKLKPSEAPPPVPAPRSHPNGKQSDVPAGATRAENVPIHHWQISAALDIPPVPCQVALAALPAELTPMLQGFKLQGTFKSEIKLGIELVHVRGEPLVVPDVDLGGMVGIDGCKVVAAPEQTAISNYAGPFEHAVEVIPGEWATFLVGPENPDWVPYADISPHLINSIMTTEDSTFMRHHGFIPSEFRSALKANLERGYFRLGASSITMQMVKNVMLSREKTLSRKLQEMFLTWYVERSLPKERILEIYFNVIEFGPRVYGIGGAARHYFGKHARDLTPREAAWFSSILPSPKRRYVHFCKGAPDNKWELYLNRILRRMHERNRLTDEQYEKAIDARLVFDRKEALPETECLQMVRRLVAPPPGGPSTVAAHTTTISTTTSDEDGDP